ncbi:hypothetical protein GCM10027217_32570 [Pseudomaricurvus hydrocarbonicus]
MVEKIAVAFKVQMMLSWFSGYKTGSALNAVKEKADTLGLDAQCVRVSAACTWTTLLFAVVALINRLQNQWRSLP